MPLPRLTPPIVPRYRADVRVLAVLASAAVWTSAFPPRGWWLVAWIGVVPFLVAVRAAPTLLRAGVLAWLWCVAFAWCIGAWLPGGVVRYFDQPALVGAAFFLATATLTAGLHYIGFAVAYRALARRHSSAVLPLLAAAAFVAAELLRVRGPGADPWGLVGYSQAGVIALPQIADVTGVYGVTFAVLAVNAALAELWLAYRVGASIVPAARGLALAGSLVVVLTAYGAFRIGSAPHHLADADAARVAIAQGDIGMHAQWLPSDYGKNLDVYLRLTDDVLARERVALVVWPESAMTFFVDEEPDYRGAIARVTAPHGVQLLAGAPRAADPAHTAFFNSVFLLGPDGEPIGRYDKQLLLPFAEYFPLSVDLLRRRFGRVRQFTPGGPAAVSTRPRDRQGCSSVTRDSTGRSPPTGWPPARHGSSA